jgi:hypothetical protein
VNLETDWRGRDGQEVVAEARVVRGAGGAVSSHCVVN